jgi:hypothetical protein
MTPLKSELFRLPVDGLDLLLRRYASTAVPSKTVLLIHGASASSDTFLVPDGGLVKHLHDCGWDVWTLDWRGSLEIVDNLPPPPAFLGGSLEEECKLFTIDKVAERDFPEALKFINEKLVRETAAENPDPATRRAPSVAVVAHCFGAGALAVALARGRVEGAGVSHVVLSTLGLFYEVPWNGWVKVEDFIIERILGASPAVRAIDPRVDLAGEELRGVRPPLPWPPDMATAYGVWPRSWLPQGPTAADKIYNRLSFMFGEPYARALLAPGIHGPGLARLFGGMHLGLYLHAGQMVRRGYAAPLDAIDVVDRARLSRRRAVPPGGVVGDLRPTYFRDKTITLITGAQNQLWHRDSIDLMYEWLLGHCPGCTVTKHVFPELAHQDLLWGTTAKAVVYGKIAAGLSGSPQ